MGERIVIVLVGVERHLLADEPLDIAQVGALVLLVAEGDGNALRPSSTCAPNAVHVGLWDVRNLEVDDVTQFIDVDATGGNVGGHQHAEVAAFEGLHRLLALGLALVAVDGLTAHTLFAEVADQFVRAVLGAGEDQCTRYIGCGQHIDQQVLLLGLANEVDFLLDRFRRAAAALHLHGDRVQQDGVGQLLDVLRHRGREEQGLAPWGKEFDDLPDVVDEAHVEHRVGFVQHEVLEVVQTDVALADKVQKAPGGGHDNVHTTLKRGDLLALFDPAEDDGVVELLVLAVVADALADLGGEFARWTQDQGADDPASLPARLLAEPMGMGREKAAVLPVPVWATPRTSLPSMTWGMAWAWMGVGVS